MWRTFVLPSDPKFISYARCLWCGERGHWRESCAREHAHGAVTRGEICLGCQLPASDLVKGSDQ